MAIPLIAWEVGAIVVGSLAKAFTYEKSDAWTPQEEQYAATVERYKQIREQRQAAISFASGLSGLPESTFYGRKGLKLMRNDTLKVGQTSEESQKETVAEVQSYESQLDAGNVTPPSMPVRKFEQASTYADAMKSPDVKEAANQVTAPRLADAGKTVRNISNAGETTSEVWDENTKKWRKFTPDPSGKGYQPASQQYGGG